MHEFKEAPPHIPLDLNDLSPRARGTFQNEPQTGLLSPSQEIVLKRLEIEEFREELATQGDSPQRIREYLWHRERMADRLKGQEVQRRLRDEVARNQVLTDQVADLGNRLRYWQETNFVYKERDSERPKRFLMDNGAFVTTSPLQHEYQIRVDKLKDRFKHAFINMDVDELQALLRIADEQRVLKSLQPEIAIAQQIFRRHHRLTGDKITLSFEHESDEEDRPPPPEHKSSAQLGPAAPPPRDPGLDELQARAEKLSYKRLNNLLKMNEAQAALIKTTHDKASKFLFAHPPPRVEPLRAARPTYMKINVPPPKPSNLIYKRGIQRIGHLDEHEGAPNSTPTILPPINEFSVGRVGMTGQRGGAGRDGQFPPDPCYNYNQKP